MNNPAPTTLPGRHIMTVHNTQLDPDRGQGTDLAARAGVAAGEPAVQAWNRAFDEVCAQHPLPGDEPEQWVTDRRGTHWVIDDDTPTEPTSGGVDLGATGSSATFTLAELVALDDAIDRGDDIAVAQILAGPDSRDEQPPWTPLPATTAQRMQADLPAREEQLQRWHADDHTLTPGMDERAAGWDR